MAYIQGDRDVKKDCLPTLTHIHSRKVAEWQKRWLNLRVCSLARDGRSATTGTPHPIFFGFLQGVHREKRFSRMDIGIQGNESGEMLRIKKKYVQSHTPFEKEKHTSSTS